MTLPIHRARWPLLVLVIAGMTAGCGAPISQSDDSVATTRQALKSDNGIWQNGLTTNGIWQNGIWQNGIWQNGIWQNGIWQNGIWQNGIWQNGIWQNGIWQNGIWQNGIWQNGFWDNGLGQNGIWQNGIWQNGIWQNGIWQNGLPADSLKASSYARQLLQYVYACGMPPDVIDSDGKTVSSYATTLDPDAGIDCSVDADCGSAYSCTSDRKCVVKLTGSVGLGINADGSNWWTTGKCDESCQRWVSACVLARTNAYGVHVDISMRAPDNAPQAIKDALATTQAELDTYALREGAFYGNIFATTAAPPAPLPPPSPDFTGPGPDLPAPGPITSTPSFYACAGPGSNIPEVTKRFCSSQGDQVVINVPGVCVATATAPGACDGTDATGSIFGCFTSTDATQPRTLYDEVITVYLKKPIAVCGNAVCENGETTTSCASDCPSGWAKDFAPGIAGGIVDPSSFGLDFAKVSMSAVSPVDDTVVVAGTTSSNIDLGSGNLDQALGVGVLAKYNSDGTPAWGRRFGGTELQEVNAVAVAPNGNFVVAGSAVLTNATDQNRAIWISTYTADGAPVPDETWTLPIGSIDTLTRLQLTRAFAIDSKGNFILSGTYVGTASFGSNQLTSWQDGCTTCPPAAADVFTAKLSPKRNVLWALAAGVGTHYGDAFPKSLAVGSNDEIVALISSGNSWEGIARNSLIKMSSDGVQIWKRLTDVMIGEGTGTEAAVSIDGAGNVYVGGLERPSGTGGLGPTITKYDGAGVPLWGNGGQIVCGAVQGCPDYNAGNHVEGVGIGFDPSGNVILASFGNPVVGGGIDFGTGLFPTYKSNNIFLSAYTPDTGQVVWAKQIPTILSSSLLGIALDHHGRVVVSGNYSGSMQVANRLLVTRIPEQPKVIDSFLASYGIPSTSDTTAPGIGDGKDETGSTISTVPKDIFAHATSEQGAVVFYMPPTAIDDGNAGTSVSCLPPPNTMFPIGVTTVDCSASDPLGNRSSATFTITVDDPGPFFAPPTNMTAPASGPGGATVTYSTPTAIDQIDGSEHPVSCDPPSGSVFLPGDTTVTCISSDDAGNQSKATFVVSVSDGTTDTTPPFITVPAPMTVSAANASGAVVTYSASATDDFGVTTFSCSKASGSTFPLGTTTVTCNASDAAGNPSSASFTVTVADKTAPTLSVPGNITAEATGPNGGAIVFAATAIDNVDATVIPTCSAASGSVFPVGSTGVSCTAVDAAGNSTSQGFTVTVVDTTPPALLVPNSVTAAASSPSGAPVSYATSASDSVDGSVGVVCAPASGTVFPVGSTTVSCTATDAHGNATTKTFPVTVTFTTDATPPILTLPSPSTVAATTASGATVSYSASATDAVDGPISPVCTPDSGSSFGLGSTTVSCTATDAHGNSTTQSFQVQVQFPWSGVLQPVNADNSSVFKLGNTIPVKFSLTGASAGVTNAVANLFLSKISSSVTGTVIETVSNSSATSGNAFRYDGGQYIFNLSTKGLSTGTWQLSIDLHDGVSRTVTISLR